ncbi:late histone H1-like [Teleopsis dalmanni]|uniref:late histone H1-like n=1 Tax=Teleopsis dalmanni TaxID=139649 RepID=UPI0018CE7B3B|nr:late histone H1-like [Teleopsis dalmanni]XP_037960635.1 late histone H1-like [Teleopsis dalmanni]
MTRGAKKVKSAVLTPTQEKLAIIGKAEFGGVKQPQKRAKVGRGQHKRAARAVRKAIKRPGARRGARRGAVRGRANKVASTGKSKRPRKPPKRRGKRKGTRRRIVKRRAPPVRKGGKRKGMNKHKRVRARVRIPSDTDSDIRMPEVAQPIVDIPPPNFLIRFWQPFTFLAALTTYWIYNV